MGDQKGLKWFSGALGKKYDIKSKVAGPSTKDGECSEAEYLGRTVKWHNKWSFV